MPSPRSRRLMLIRLMQSEKEEGGSRKQEAGRERKRKKGKKKKVDATGELGKLSKLHSCSCRSGKS